MLALFVALGCSGPDEAPPPCPDADGDGYEARRCADGPADCDDADADVHPDAPEQCNDRDDDCDGAVDEELPIEPFWLDFDGDGFGDPEVWLERCAVPEGYTDVALDCDDNDPAQHPVPASRLRFSDATVEAGLDVEQWASPPYPCGFEVMGGGVAVGDVDGDDWPDVLLVGVYAPDRLLLNRGDGTFADATEGAGLATDDAGGGALLADVDGDGDLDAYVTSTGEHDNRLYINAGDGTFSEEAVARGADAPRGERRCGLAFSASAADIDGDGDLDLHTTSWRDHGAPDAQRARLLRNDGTGHFTDATAELGLDLQASASFTSQLADIDGDGFLDVAVAADWETSRLLLGGPTGFVDATAAAGVGSDENGMGADLGDYDNDGDLDWFVTSIFDSERPCSDQWGCTGNRLYRNDGATFTDVAEAAGVADGGWGWGVAFADLDADGWLDAVQASGFPTPPFRTNRTRLFVGTGSSFADAACAAGFVPGTETRAVVPFDSDGDGDLDVLLTRAGRGPRLLRAEHTTGAWLQLKLEQADANAHAIGAVVRVDGPLGTLRRDVHANSRFASVGPAEVHFGLGALAEATVDVEVTWPDGVEQVFVDVPLGARTVLRR